MGKVPVAVLTGNIVQKLLFDAEFSSGNRDIGRPRRLDFRCHSLQQTAHMRRIVRRADRGHCRRFRNLFRRSQDGRSPQTVTDQNTGSLMVLTQPRSRRDEIGDIGGKIRVGKISFARAQTGKIKP